MKYFCFALLVIIFPLVCLQAQVTSFQEHDFVKADSVAALYPAHSLRNLKILSDKLTLPFSTEVDKFRAIYTWVCNNIENDYGFYLKNKKKREKFRDHPQALKEWNNKNIPDIFKKLVNRHKTICTGYAYLVKELAYHAGITCKIIDGYGRTAQVNIGGPGIANHSWNAVQLNGQWYLCDATWSSGTNDPQKAKFIKKYTNAYFLTSPSLFVRNHYPLDTTWILLKENPTLREFLNRPLIYRDALSHNILPVSPQTFHVTVTKGEQVDFRFCNYSKKAIDKIELQINYGRTSNSFFLKLGKQSDESYHVTHVFTRKGNYAVHLLLRDDYLFSYEVKVGK